LVGREAALVDNQAVLEDQQVETARAGVGTRNTERGRTRHRDAAAEYCRLRLGPSSLPLSPRRGGEG
jgi:hypothetical protein